MKFEELKNILSDDKYLEKNAFDVLKSISDFTNYHETEKQGRELVIRALNKKSFFNKHEPILFDLIKSMGLYPYYTEFVKNSSNIKDLLSYEFHRPFNFDEGLVFHELQLKIYNSLINGNNVVLSGPTSVGKSLIIDALIATRRYQTIVLVLPTIALIDETRIRLTSRFDFCKLITHPSQLKSNNKDVTNIYILTQERVLERGDLENVDFFVIDEFYQLDPKLETEDSRAITLNLALYKLLKVSKQFYLIGPNIDNISGLQELGRDYIFFPSDFATVAVDTHCYNFQKTDPRRDETLIKLCRELEGSILIYCQSPRSVSEVANLLIHNDVISNPNINEAIDWISEEYHSDWIFTQALNAGIGLHHGGIPRAFQQLCIRLFNKKTIRILICTSTIIEGVNTVAKNVIIYDRRKSNKLLTYFTYKNIEGRAGRMGQFYVGSVYSLETAPEAINNDVNIPIGQQDEQSSLNLLMHIDNDDLKEVSKLRLNEEFALSPLSEETLKANFPYKINFQNDLAEELIGKLQHYNEILNWTTFPNGEQLKETCNLIFDYLENTSLRQYNINSGNSLAYYLEGLRAARGYSEFIKQKLAEDPDNPDKVLETSLKIVRNVFCFSFPRALRALEVIQKELFSSKNMKFGSYNGYASQVENLFMDAILFALDEYGVPIQTSNKLSEQLKPDGNLDSVLDRLRNLNVNKAPITKFEKSLLKEIIPFI